MDRSFRGPSNCFFPWARRISKVTPRIQAAVTVGSFSPSPGLQMPKLNGMSERKIARLNPAGVVPGRVEMSGGGEGGFGMGRANSGGGSFRGFLDDIRIYDKELSAEEIEAIRKSTPREFSIRFRIIRLGVLLLAGLLSGGSCSGTTGSLALRRGSECRARSVLGSQGLSGKPISRITNRQIGRLYEDPRAGEQTGGAISSGTFSPMPCCMSRPARQNIRGDAQASGALASPRTRQETSNFH